MTKIVSKNGTMYLGKNFDKNLVGRAIRVFLTGIKNPVYSSIRSTGVAYIGTRWKGFVVEWIQIEQDIPA